MRLLVINWFDRTHPLWGGAEVYLHEVFGRLARRGHQVTLLCSSYAGGAREETIDGIRILRRGWFWTFHLQVPWYYRRELAHEPWDCVFEYTNKIPMLTPLYVRRPLVAVAHHLFGRSIFHESRPPIAAYVYAMERLLPLFYRRTPWIAVSESTRAELAALGIPVGRVAVIPNGVDTPHPLLPLSLPVPRTGSRRMDPCRTGGPPSPSGGEGESVTRRAGGVSASPHEGEGWATRRVRGEAGVGTGSPWGVRAPSVPEPRIAWVGRMKRYKRVDVLLRAMPEVLRRVPDARLELAGDGVDGPRLRALAQELGLGPERVRFLGTVAEEEKHALLARAAVLAQPSLKEGWGRTVLEAGAHGVPAVASDVAGLRESVRHGETGVLVPPADPAALAAALADLLLDEPRRRTLGEAAREWAARFSWDASAEATERLAAELSAREPLGSGRPLPVLR